MLELLQPKRGDKVLDVGSGSGWQTALLAHIVGTEGTVIGIERIPELKEMGEKYLPPILYRESLPCFRSTQKTAPERSAI